MKWFLTFTLLFSNGVYAENSILFDKKSFVNQVNGPNIYTNAEGSPEKPQEKLRSEHYKETFEKLLTYNNSEVRTNALKACNMLINASLKLESGEINIDQFSSIEREAQILWTTESIEKSDPVIEYRESYKSQPPQNKSTNCTSTTSGNTVFTNCY